MTNTASTLQLTPEADGTRVRRARVTARHERDGESRHLLRPADGGAPLEAATALAGGAPPEPGDEVLMLSESADRHWIVGVIGRARSESAAARQVTAPNGAVAGLEQGESGVRLVVRESSGRLLFEHDPESGRSAVHVAAGDLALHVPDGALTLAAGKGLRLEAAQEVEIVGREGVKLRCDGDDAQSASRLELAGGQARLAAGSLLLAVRDASLVTERARLAAATLSANVRRARTRFGTLDLSAERLVQRTRESYVDVREVYRLRAGRLWGTVAGALQLKGETATLRARRRVKIDGERIDLG